MSTKVADSAVSELEAFFLRRNDIINRWGNIIASFQALPGLVGFWPMSSVQRSTGNAYDLSGQGRTLTYNGNPTYNIYNGLVPYIDLDGAGDFLSRADETDLDILGTETIFASAVRGLTMMGWFRPDTIAPGVALALMGKSNNGAQKSWDVYLNVDGTVIGRVSGDGTNVTQAVSAPLTDTNWVFVCLKYVPSTSVSIFINKSAPVTNVVGVPAAIFNSTSALTVGAFSGGGNTFFGHAALVALCANALPNAMISGLLFEQTRLLFGQ